MGLDDIVRAGVAVANSLTSSLQVLVTHDAWTGRSGDDLPVYNGGGAGTQRYALVEMASGLVRGSNGQELTQKAKVTFLYPIAANGASGRREPIDPRDRITLPDGTTFPILDVRGLVDPEASVTGAPYLFEVILG